MIEWVELRGGDVEGALLREPVVQGRVEGHQVHVVHGQVVRVIAALQVAHVDQGRAVEPEKDRPAFDTLTGVTVCGGFTVCYAVVWVNTII